MKALKRIAILLAVAATLTGTLCAATLLVWRHRHARAMTISTPDGIDEGLFTEIGGIEQWVTIRGKKRDNPVLFLLHGGPGGATSAFSWPALWGWENHFVVVQWDQRGAGKSYGRSGPLLPGTTVERMAQDGIEVAEFIQKRLGRQHVSLVGTSWGSVLGMYMIRARPDLFSAYVGTGQLVNHRRSDEISYRVVLERARARGDAEAVAQLERIGPPPYASFADFLVERHWAYTKSSGYFGLLRLLASSSRNGAADMLHWLQGFQSSSAYFYGADFTGPLPQMDLTSLGNAFEVPIYLFMGANDELNPPQLAREYLDGIRAPRKRFELIQNYGHDVSSERGDLFLKFLLDVLADAS